jgi:FKBP-type peptidyl-prolyl cis-trans isomerase
MRLGILLAMFVALGTVSANAADSALGLAANAAYLADNAKKRGVITTPDGLQYRIIQNGFGARPKQFDSVTVYYSGHLINGKVFDSTEPGLPAKFTTNKLILGWTEALELMREGDHWELTIPAALAYGTRGAGDGLIPPGQTLVFDLQLLTVTPAPPDRDDQDQGGSGH